MVVGSRAQVMHGTADKTPGGLQKKDLKYNKAGKIVSKRKSLSAKKDNRLVKAGYKTEKGKFGAVYQEPGLKERRNRLERVLLKKPEEKKGIQKEIKYIV